MNLADTIGTVLGSVTFATVATTYLNNRARRDETHELQSAGVNAASIASTDRERDITASFAREARKDHKGCLERVEELHKAQLEQAKLLARCETQHEDQKRVNEELETRLSQVEKRSTPPPSAEVSP